MAGKPLSVRTNGLPRKAPAGRPSCRHCRECPANRPRGLCWTCYHTPGLRDRYPSTSKFTRRGVADRCGPAPVPPTPTDAPPGSRPKVAVLEARAAQGSALWHPDDAGWEAWEHSDEPLPGVLGWPSGHSVPDQTDTTDED